MTDPELVRYFIENIEYKNKGIMLDTGHLLNTNLDINNEEEGIDYLVETISNLGDMKDYIKGIHLSKSLSGKYVKEQIEKYKNKDIDYSEANNEIIYHILNIDEHKPFTNNKIKNLFEVTRVYQAHIPTYPSGHWLFGFASKKFDPIKNHNKEAWENLNLKTKYYNSDIHKGAFMLPQYVKDMLNENE